MSTVFRERIRRHKRAGMVLSALVGLYALVGFVVLPWIIPRVAGDVIQDTYGADLRFGNVAMNPFALSLRIDDLSFDDPDGESLLAVDQIFVNFQSSSLFRLAWTFDEVRLDAPRLSLSRDADGLLNVAFLVSQSEPQTQVEPEVTGESGIPKLLVFRFAINNSVVDWRDRLPPEPVFTRLGPVDVNIEQLNTLPSRAGEQSVVIATETQGTLSWSGSLQLNPFRSAGRASVKGSHSPLISSYIRHQIGFEIVESDADLGLAYEVGIRDDGELQARIDNLALSIAAVRIRPYIPGNAADADMLPDVLSVPSFAVQGGSLRWPERDVSIESLEIKGATLNVDRDSDGSLNVIPRIEGAETQPDVDEAPGGDSLPWRVSLDRLLLDQAAVSFEDETVSPAAALGLEQIRLSMTDLSNAAGAEFPVEFSTALTTGGTINAQAQIAVLPAVDASVELQVEQVALRMLQPYLQAVADISLDSGLLSVSGSVEHAVDQPLAFAGDASIMNLLVTETDEGTRLGSWTEFGVDGISLDLSKRTLSVDLLNFVEPYVDILIAEDGSVNLGRAGKDDVSAAAVGDAEESDADQSPFDVTIGGVEISTASARFADLALPLPFETEIAELNGSLSTIATSSVEPAAVDLVGKVDTYGRVRVSGSVTPLDPPRNTDLSVIFENVEMPKMSAYTIPFAGREIARGRLDLDLGYRIENGSLAGENGIVLRDLELGDRVAHPDAASLPLGLAVALLKDANGNIDIDLPVRGDINDPEFSYGQVVRRALTNLIVRIAASPFALLGNLLGVEADELEFLSFDYGLSELSPPEIEKVRKLAEALALRPELALDVPPVVDAERDRAALQAAQLDALVAERLASLDTGTVPVAERRMTVLEAIFTAETPGEEGAAALGELRAEFTRTPQAGAEDVAPASEFDALAFAAALEGRLADRQVLLPDALGKLALQRAQNVRQAIAEVDGSLDARVVVVDSTEVSDQSDGSVRMRVALAAGEDGS